MNQAQRDEIRARVLALTWPTIHIDFAHGAREGDFEVWPLCLRCNTRFVGQLPSGRYAPMRVLCWPALEDTVDPVGIAVSMLARELNSLPCACGERVERPVLQPVRWWRDDVDRYRLRCALNDGAYRPHPDWAFELPKPVNSEIYETINRMHDRMIEACAIQLPRATELGSQHWAWRGGSPVFDVARLVEIQRRDVELANLDTNPIEEVLVGESEGVRVMIGRRRDGTFIVLDERKIKPTTPVK